MQQYDFLTLFYTFQMDQILIIKRFIFWTCDGLKKMHHGECRCSFWEGNLK